MNLHSLVVAAHRMIVAVARFHHVAAVDKSCLIPIPIANALEIVD